jgi:quinol-cytochrome oxidoreductase complex cytochrome b subunit
MVGQSTSMFIHLFSALLLNAYRRSRNDLFHWLTRSESGVCLLATLPWNDGFFATRVGTEIPGAVPVIGFLRRLSRGGNEITGRP